MKKLKNILILAGGENTRFWPLDNKNLFYFLGKPLLNHLIDSVSKYTNKIIVVIHPSLKGAPELKKIHNADIIVQNNEITGMAGAVISAKHKINGEVLILNANDLIDFNKLENIIKLKDKNDVILMARHVDKYFPGGYLRFKSGKLNSIIEKPDDNNVPSNLIKLVVDYFKDIKKLTSVLKTIKSKSDNAYEKAITKLIQNSNTGYLKYNKYWHTIKYPWHILEVMNFFLLKINKSKISPSALISKSAIIKGPVIIKSNVKIGDFVKILGPCFIDEKTIIADYTIVRNSHIGKKCIIGSNSEIARSYIGNNTLLHQNYIGDSVLGNNVLFGAGTITANFRFDEKIIKSSIKNIHINTNLYKFGAIVGNNSKIGVNTTLLPGVKIGENCRIMPGSIIQKDIENNIFFAKKK